MNIGHICLTVPYSEASENFAALVEALDDFGVSQHVLVANVALAQRLAECTHVTVGPLVKTPIMAYCLMPEVDVAHMHEGKSGQSGLLLTLTRSIPFVITIDNGFEEDKGPIADSVLNRAVQTIERREAKPGDLEAGQHLNIYEDACQNSHRTPTASDRFSVAASLNHSHQISPDRRWMPGIE
jgi:hypothetical protein